LACCFGLSLRDIYSQFHLQQKALDAAMNDINSSFGKGSVTRLGSAGGAFVYVCSFLIPSLKSSLAITLFCISIILIITVSNPVRHSQVVV